MKLKKISRIETEDKDILRVEFEWRDKAKPFSFAFVVSGDEANVNAIINNMGAFRTGDVIEVKISKTNQTKLGESDEG